MNNQEQLDAFEAYMELLAQFDSFEEFIANRDKQEVAHGE